MYDNSACSGGPWPVSTGDPTTVRVFSIQYRSCDILPRLKSRASRGSDVTPVDSDGWESKVSDRRQWQCHATDTRSRRGVASYLVVLCRSARSAHCFDFGSRRGKHRVNCQFSAHIPGYDTIECKYSLCIVKVNEDSRFIPRLKSWVFSPCKSYKNETTGGYTPSDRNRSIETRAPSSAMIAA